MLYFDLERNGVYSKYIADIGFEKLLMKYYRIARLGNLYIWLRMTGADLSMQVNFNCEERGVEPEQFYKGIFNVRDQSRTSSEYCCICDWICEEFKCCCWRGYWKYGWSIRRKWNDERTNRKVCSWISGVNWLDGSAII